MFRCGLCVFYEFEESELKEHIEEKHHGLYLEAPAEENNNKHEEEVDKESVKVRKQEKNDSIWLEKSANVEMNPSMSTCQHRCSETREVSG